MSYKRAGGGFIGDNCSISMRVTIYTASHNVDDDKFGYYEKSTVINDGVWLGVGAVVLAGSEIEDGCVIAAGAVCTPKKYERKCIYAGVPAIKIRERNINEIENLKHDMVFR